MSELDRIKRAHENNRPKDTNPAWKNCHRDLATCLVEIERLQARVSELEGVYEAAHRAAMFSVRDGDGEVHIVPRYMQPLDDALNRAALQGVLDDKEETE